MNGLSLTDLLGALALADATCASDTAWDAVYEDAASKLTDEEKTQLPTSKELRDNMHALVHGVIQNVIAAGVQSLSGGGLPAPRAALPTTNEDDPDLHTGFYL